MFRECGGPSTGGVGLSTASCNPGAAGIGPTGDPCHVGEEIMFETDLLILIELFELTNGSNYKYLRAQELVISLGARLTDYFQLVLNYTKSILQNCFYIFLKFLFS